MRLVRLRSFRSINISSYFALEYIYNTIILYTIYIK